MRLFTGIALPRQVRDNLARVLKELRPLAPLKWSPVENLHITSKFIGQWPEERLAELEGALEKVNFGRAVEVAVARFGFFPNPHHPHTFFAGVQEDTSSARGVTGFALAEAKGGVETSLDAARTSAYATFDLAELASGIDEALRPLGIAKEDRPYSPHLTLARIKHEDIRELRQHIAKMTNFDFGTFQVSEFHLYLSKIGPSGSIYTPLATFPLLAAVKA